MPPLHFYYYELSAIVTIIGTIVISWGIFLHLRPRVLKNVVSSSRQDFKFDQQTQEYRFVMRFEKDKVAVGTTSIDDNQEDFTIFRLEKAKELGYWK